MFKVMSREKSIKGHTLGVDMGYRELGAVAKGGQRIKEYKKVCTNERHMYHHIYIKQESVVRLKKIRTFCFALKS